MFTNMCQGKFSAGITLPIVINSSIITNVVLCSFIAGSTRITYLEKHVDKSLSNTWPISKPERHVVKLVFSFLQPQKCIVQFDGKFMNIVVKIYSAKFQIN